MENNDVYQFLDDLGTQEFLNVMLEIIENNFTDNMINDITETSSDDDLLSTAGTINLIDRLNELINALQGTVDEVSEEVDSLAGYIGVNSYKAKVGADILTHLTISLVTGNIDQIAEPKSDVLYFMHENDSDNNWSIYIWDGIKWLIVGESKYELLNIWSRDETNEFIEYFRSKTMNKMSKSYISNRVREVFNRIIH